MVGFLHAAYLYFGFFLFGLAMLIVFPIVGLAEMLLPDEANEKVKLYCMKFWASSFYTFGVWFYHKGSKKAQTDWPAGPVIIVANHNSLLDTPAIYLMLKRFAKPLAKIELTQAPVFGHLCRWITLPVDRKSISSRQKAMSDMNAYLMNGGSLVIFPEGQMNKSTKDLQPFETGAFRLSFELGVPIAPIVIKGSKHCLAATKPLVLRHGIVSTEAGPIFYPNRYNTFLEMQQAVYQWYLGKLSTKSNSQTVQV